MAGLNEDIKVYGESFFDDTTVPQNDTTSSDGYSVSGHAVLGSYRIKAVVGDTKINLLDTQVLTVTLQDSDTDVDGDYADLATVYTITASGATELAVDEELGELVLPYDTKTYVRAVVTTDSAAATGTISVYPVYLPR